MVNIPRQIALNIYTHLPRASDVDIYIFYRASDPPLRAKKSIYTLRYRRRQMAGEWCENPNGKVNAREVGL